MNDIFKLYLPRLVLPNTLHMWSINKRLTPLEPRLTAKPVHAASILHLQ